MKAGDNICFDSRKNFKYIKPLGDGGTGDTHLFKDETTDMLFAIKKYLPKDKQYIVEYYQRFVDEIKILFRISHPNIVRIYNYYLYPNEKTGFLQMEYVDGYAIDKFAPTPDFGKQWHDIFKDVILAFEYLEQHKILHRDVRPSNIMIDNDNSIKIIDFGFGKQLEGATKDENSILLNWPVTELPDEVQLHKKYDTRTEIYFVGALFRKLLKDIPSSFRYQHIIDKMIKINPNQRYSSFTEIVFDLSSDVLGDIDFTHDQKYTYRAFADALSNHINYFYKRYTPINDIKVPLSKLAELIRQCSLEECIQDNSILIECFYNSGFNYSTTKNIPSQLVVDFYELVTSLSSTKQQILLDNINSRLSTIKVQEELMEVDDDDLPF